MEQHLGAAVGVEALRDEVFECVAWYDAGPVGELTGAVGGAEQAAQGHHDSDADDAASLDELRCSRGGL